MRIVRPPYFIMRPSRVSPTMNFSCGRVVFHKKFRIYICLNPGFNNRTCPKRFSNRRPQAWLYSVQCTCIVRGSTDGCDFLGGPEYPHEFRLIITRYVKYLAQQCR